MRLYITIDHSTIVAWALEHGASPSTIEGDGRSWPLLFDFHPPSPGIVVIGWDSFFEEFEQSDLAFVYPEAPPSGRLDVSHQFVKRAALPHLTFSGKPTIVELVS
jgi:hypothetical protein